MKKRKVTNKSAKRAARKVMDRAWSEAEGLIKFPSEEMMPVIREGSEIQKQNSLKAIGIDVDAEVKLLGPPGPPAKDTFLENTKEQARRRRTLYEPACSYFEIVAAEVKAEREAKEKEPVMDALGRIKGRTYPEQLDDELPDFLKESAVTITKDKKMRPVQIHRDHSLAIPTLCFAVYVLGDWDVPDDEARFAKMFARSGCKKAKSIEEADLVVFGGGSDVDPALYSEKRHETTFFDSNRDSQDIDAYAICLKLGIPMFGVCRGAQFLHVANGGKLIQDLDGHCGAHSMLDIKGGKFIDRVSSVHHQAVLGSLNSIKNGMDILATAAMSMKRSLNPNETQMGKNADIEAFFYRDTCCLGVQGHPEYEGYNYFTNWCLEKIHEYIFMNPDLHWTEERTLRMKPDLLAERSVFKPTLEVPLPKKA